MHIAQGYLPLVHCAFWGAVCLPFVIDSARALTRPEVRERRFELAAAGGLPLLLSALKIPSVAGSCSHPTGVALSAILFGSRVVPLALAALMTERTGSVNRAVALVGERKPGYEPWASPVGSIPSPWGERAMFGLPAAAGAGLFAFAVRARRGASRAKTVRSIPGFARSRDKSLVPPMRGASFRVVLPPMSASSYPCFWVFWFVMTSCVANGQSISQQRLVLQRSQHFRMTVPHDILRVAVGDSLLLSAEPIGSRELLILGKNWGRTSLIVWLRDLSVREYPVSVERDIALLQSALRRIHPNLVAEIAPDRDAIVLSGTVPDLAASRAAESLTRNYLDSGRPNDVLTRATGDEANPAANPAPPANGEPEVVRLPPLAAANTAAPQQRGSGAVLNLIRLERLPQRLEEKVLGGIQAMGGKGVTMRRLQKGSLPDDTRDAFLLEGKVPNQVALVRILTLAAQSILGRTATQEDVTVVADESGALASNLSQQGGQQQGGQLGGGAGTQSLLGSGGGGSNSRLSNQVNRNLGRAKVVEVAGGRILSFLQVSDLPQVRVNIRLYEVNRSKLRTFSPNFGLLTSSANQGSLSPPLAAQAFQGAQAQRTGGAGRNAVQSVLSFLGGTLASQTQLSTAHFAIDAALAYLERVGVARSLSSPNLTVLSGEQAIFQVGGQIPIPQSFFAAGNTVGSTTGVFSSVVFEEFGIRLSVRPLVDEGDAITLDVQPQIITPNADLTSSIRQSTGTNQLTTAFLSRALRTSARLQDGQALLVGGLLSRESNDTRNSTPGARDVPGLGWLFKDFNNTDDTRELIILVNPVVVRDPIPGVGLWEFPSTSELVTPALRWLPRTIPVLPGRGAIEPARRGPPLTASSTSPVSAISSIPKDGGWFASVPEMQLAAVQ